MKYRKLGNTGEQVSVICLGTMTFGEQNTQHEAFKQLDFALDSGINFVDTAEMYSSPARAETQGDSERIIGKWLGQRKYRDRIFLATKITGPKDYFSYIRDPLDFSPSQIRQALTGSLRRLQTDYVDLYQLHWPERNTNYFGKRGYEHDPEEKWSDNFLQILETMQSLMKEGLIRHYGVSNETPWGLMRYLHLADIHDMPRPVSIQNPYSLLNRTFETGLAEISCREEVGLLAYSPLAFGWLSGKYHNGSDVSRSRITLYPKLSRYSRRSAREATARYLEVAGEFGLSAAQMALAFVNSRPFVTSNIIGATTMSQLSENIASIDVELPAEVFMAIEGVQMDLPDPAP